MYIYICKNISNKTENNDHISDMATLDLHLATQRLTLVQLRRFEATLQATALQYSPKQQSWTFQAAVGDGVCVPGHRSGRRHGLPLLRPACLVPGKWIRANRGAFLITKCVWKDLFFLLCVCLVKWHTNSIITWLGNIYYRSQVFLFSLRTGLRWRIVDDKVAQTMAIEFLPSSQIGRRFDTQSLPSLPLGVLQQKAIKVCLPFINDMSIRFHKASHCQTEYVHIHTGIPLFSRYIFR